NAHEVYRTTGMNPGEIIAGPNNHLWFTAIYLNGTPGSYMFELDPATESILNPPGTPYPLGHNSGYGDPRPDFGPAIVYDADRNGIWFASKWNRNVGIIHPGGAVDVFTMPVQTFGIVYDMQHLSFDDRTL